MSVRVAFLGAGGIAKTHMDILAKMDDVRMVAFCDVDPQRANEAANQYDGRAYTDFREMLEKEDFEALYVCLPPFAHEDQELLATKKGIHLFVEKPVALDAETADRVSEAIEKNGTISSVGYNWRYLDLTGRMAEVLKRKKISFALGSWIGGFVSVPWWRVMGKSGGQMVEQTTHIFDLARYFLGEVKTVYAIANSGTMLDIPEYDIHDSSTVSLFFHSGAICNITSACIAGQSPMVALKVYTRDLTVENDYQRLTIYRPGHREVIENGNNPYLEEDKAFIDAVRTGDTSKIHSTYSDAVRTLKVTLAANESIKGGKPVQLQY
ncbi:MAG TPA: Gfo/Idh/MocA family oxidoreductase [Candidatus Latescibacteria bacterium]|nr:Gfo/Idh/MocA family oxidoreductase [Candidatus Latescibacterota bacterium]